MVKAIIFDYARTIADIDTNPPRLFAEAAEILEQLKRKGLRMALVSTGEDPDARTKEFEQLQLNRYFDILDIVGPEGTKDFKHILEQLAVAAKSCLVVGDRIRSEIEQGNIVGATTVWLKQGKFSQELPENPLQQPDFIIKSLTELMPILQTPTRKSDKP